MESKIIIKDVRNHILQIGQILISGKGFSAVGLNEILRSSGVPKGSFYHYFGSKEVFGEELLKNYFINYQKSLEEILSCPGISGAERLIRYCQSWLTVQSAYNTSGGCCLAVKLAAEVSDLSNPMRIVLKHGTDQVIERLALAIDYGIYDGSLTVHLNSKMMASTTYQLWLGASLRTKITRDLEPMESAFVITKEFLGLNRS